MNGPAWTIASFIPVYGDDIKLVRGMMEQADILAQDAMPVSYTHLDVYKRQSCDKILLIDSSTNSFWL